MSPRIRVAAVTAALLVALAGCGSGGSGTTASDPASESSSTSPSASESASAPSAAASPSETTSPGADASDEPVVLPACSEVWVEGGTVPRDYEGCLDGAETVPANGRYCEFGKALFTFQQAFYAVAGGPVQATDGPLLKSARYRDALKKCSG